MFGPRTGELTMAERLPVRRGGLVYAQVSPVNSAQAHRLTLEWQDQQDPKSQEMTAHGVP